MRGDPPCGRWPGNSTIQTDTMAASGRRPRLVPAFADDFQRAPCGDVGIHTRRPYGIRLDRRQQQEEIPIPSHVRAQLREEADH